jgi:superfamily II DNA or RNA helicase
MTVTAYLGNSEGKLKGLPSHVSNEISMECSFEVKGAEKSEMYRKGRWDGRKKLFNKQTGAFAMGLWSRIREILRRHSITPMIVDERTTIRSMIEVALTESVEPRPYQNAAVEAAISNGRSLLQVATGGGKTVIASKLIAELGCNTLFIVHTKDLLYQTKKSFEEMLEGQPIGQVGDGVVDIHPITIATTQTLSKALGVKFEKGLDDADYSEKEIDKSRSGAIKKCVAAADMIIWDEVHRVACDMAMNVAKKIENAVYWVGLSASPWRDDGSELMIEACMGAVSYVVSASDLIDMGFLVPPIINRVRVPAKIPWEQDMRPYDTIYREEIVENEDRNRLILKYIEDFSALGIPSLILIQQIKHGNKLKRLISEEFDPIKFLSGRDLSITRNETIQEMRDGERLNLIASTIADEGLDIKRLTGLIMAGGGKSSTRALQRVGRVLRPFPGKTHALIIDFNDEAKYLRDHAAKRKEIYQTEPRFTILEL